MDRETGLAAEEKLNSLFQPDTLVPAQFFENLRRRAQLEPERRLMLATLEDAINCFQRHALTRGGKGRVIFDEVEQWIHDKSSDRLFSFANICEVLGLDPGYVRMGLMRCWKERQLVPYHRSKNRFWVAETRQERMRNDRKPEILVPATRSS